MIITAGQHRNEKSAVILAPLVAEELRKMGYQVKLFENPEKRTPREIGLEAFRVGRHPSSTRGALREGGERVRVPRKRAPRIRKRELEKILYSWEDSLYRRYPKIPIFHFHNYEINPTEFVSDQEMKEELNSMEGVYESFDLGDFAGDSLAHKVEFCDGCKGALIEIPAISETSLPENQLRALKKVFHPKTFRIFCSYFLDTDLEETRKQGFLSQKMVEILAKGIDYLIKNEYNLE